MYSHTPKGDLFDSFSVANNFVISQLLLTFPETLHHLSFLVYFHLLKFACPTKTLHFQLLNYIVILFLPNIPNVISITILDHLYRISNLPYFLTTLSLFLLYFPSIYASVLYWFVSGSLTRICQPQKTLSSDYFNSSLV